MTIKLFVYGTLKPDQPGHKVLGNLGVVEAAREARLLKYSLYDWDGLPIAAEDDNASVSGFLIDLDTNDVDGSLERLDAYEIGPTSGKNNRRLQRKALLINIGAVQEEAWAYVLDETVKEHVKKRLRESEIKNGNWTMAEDWVFTRVLPETYQAAKTLLEDRSGYAKHHVQILGTYFVLYSCLERLGLHLYGPRRLRFKGSKDRNALQDFLRRDFFGASSGPSWFKLNNRVEGLTVFDSDTMTRRKLVTSPPHFWATIRNNSAHQGKAVVEDYTMLLEVAVSTLGDFLALALLNLDYVSDDSSAHTLGLRSASDVLRDKWLALGFNPSENGLQSLGLSG